MTNREKEIIRLFRLLKNEESKKLLILQAETLAKNPTYRARKMLQRKQEKVNVQV